MFNWICRNRFGRRSGQGNPVAGGGRGYGRGSAGGGGGSGGGNKPGAGPGGNCICPKCGHKESHVAGQRCLDRVCPDCGTRMIRE